LARSATKTPRRRRRPEDAAEEILSAAAELLRRRPSHEVTVDAVMAHTTLSRAAFYAYFRDRADLITRLVEQVRDELDGVLDIWRDATGEPGTEPRTALLGMARIYLKHGRLLRALAEASGRDAEAEHAYKWFESAGVRDTAKRIRRGIREGRVPKQLDAEGTAQALCVMNQRYFMDKLADDPSADPEPVVDTLLAIWNRTLYGTLPTPPPAEHTSGHSPASNRKRRRSGE
jgi:AcrR family transcriptional regulator